MQLRQLRPSHLHMPTPPLNQPSLRKRQAPTSHAQVGKTKTKPLPKRSLLAASLMKVLPTPHPTPPRLPHTPHPTPPRLPHRCPKSHARTAQVNPRTPQLHPTLQKLQPRPPTNLPRPPLRRRLFHRKLWTTRKALSRTISACWTRSREATQRHD